MAVAAVAASPVLDDGKAGWLMRRLADNEANLARVAAQYAAICKEIRNDSRALAYRFGYVLESWARDRIAAQRGKAKSVKTLAGTASFRTVKGGPRLSDRASLANWAEAQDDPTKYGDFAFALSWAKVKAAITSGLDAPPCGFEVIEDREVFAIKAGDVTVDVSALMAAGAPEVEADEVAAAEEAKQIEGGIE